MINVYVAGASRNKERARAFMDRVRAHPAMTLAHDWVAHIDDADAAGHTDEDFGDRERFIFAAEDLAKLAEADAAVFLFEAEPVGRGSYVELGYAVALREVCDGGDARPWILVSGGERRSIFTVAGLVDLEVPYANIGDDIDAVAWHSLLGFAVTVDFGHLVPS